MSEAGKPQAVDEEKAIDVSQAAVSQADQDVQAAVSDYSDVAKGQQTMRVRVYSPFNDYYTGLAFSLSAENATGPFDILPRHHNFISLLQACELVIRTVKGDEQRIKISGGLIHVKKDAVTVFLDI